MKGHAHRRTPWKTAGVGPLMRFRFRHFVTAVVLLTILYLVTDTDTHGHHAFKTATDVRHNGGQNSEDVVVISPDRVKLGKGDKIDAAWQAHNAQVDGRVRGREHAAYDPRLERDRDPADVGANKQREQGDLVRGRGESPERIAANGEQDINKYNGQIGGKGAVQLEHQLQDMAEHEQQIDELLDKQDPYSEPESEQDMEREEASGNLNEKSAQNGQQAVNSNLKAGKSGADFANEKRNDGGTEGHGNVPPVARGGQQQPGVQGVHQQQQQQWYLPRADPSVRAQVPANAPMTAWPWRAIPIVFADRLGAGDTNRWLVVGIPTVKRDQGDYLLTTLRSLLDGLSEEEKSQIMIVVQIGDLDPALSTAAMTTLWREMRPEIERGLLEVIRVPAQQVYPPLTGLKEKFGDSPDRIRWRSKQVLDFALLMAYCRYRGQFYVQLEDDVIAAPHWVASARELIASAAQQAPNWYLIDFSVLGFIGKTFQAATLDDLISFFTDNYVEYPVDLLLAAKARPNKHLRFVSEKSLFQHIGYYSSLSGKIQPLQDPRFPGYKPPPESPEGQNPAGQRSR